jgi:hypothetical protein
LPGIYLVIAVAGILLFLRRRKRSMGRDITLAYTIVMLAIVTVTFGTTAKTTSVGLIDSQYDPDVVYGMYCSRTNIVTSALVTLQIFMSDGLLVCEMAFVVAGVAAADSHPRCIAPMSSSMATG